jgi:O-antigen biosynthesis protein WbqP
MTKRITDIVLAILLFQVASMIVALAAIAIRLDSPGPALFTQVRVGRDQRPFKLLKLRTMRVGTPTAGSHEVSASQVTRVGGWLRRYKVDELPQIWSVLKGDMSFVGPRPGLPSQHQLNAERAKRGVFAVRPGITGPAQVSGVDMSTPRELAIVDANYVAGQSWTYDLRLILATVFGRGTGDAVGPTDRRDKPESPA